MITTHTIDVDDFELKMIIEYRKKKVKDVTNIQGKYTKKTLESMLYHLRSSFSDTIYIKPGTDVNEPDVGFFTTSVGLKHGFTETISKRLIQQAYDAYI